MAMRVETVHPPVDQIVTGHFREGPGYAVWRSKGVDDWLLICTLAGRGRFGYVGGELIAQPGDIVLVRPGTLHDYGVEPTLQRWELLWSHFHPRPDWLAWLDWPEVASGLMRLHLPEGTARERVINQMRRAHDLAGRAHRRRVALAMNALELLLLMCDELNPQSEQAQIDPRLRNVIAHVALHLGEPMTLESLADVAGLSVSRFAHLFRAQLGVTPQQFVEQQRMRRARELLRFTPRSIQQIAADVGYDNPFYFTLRFRKHTGDSPRGFRARSQ